MNNRIEETEDKPNDYDRLLASIGRSFEQDQRVAYHELGHYIINRATGADSISFISITPEGNREGICRGARSQGQSRCDRPRLPRCG